MGYSLGVDLGTTFVAAATASATRVDMFTLGDRSVAIPAAVYLREDGVLITGEAAALRAVSNPDRVSHDVKRRLGNPTPVKLGGQPHTVTELLGALLRDVIQKVVATEGKPPERIVLTHPANWGPFRRALFEEVPQHANLDTPVLVTEPEAAAAHYAASRLLDDGQIVAVYDLGGGTFDATVLRKQPGGVEILGTPEGIERLGGIDFDEQILSYVDYAADGALSELDLGDPQTGMALARLRQDCVLAKEALSVDTETVIPVFLPGRHFDVRLTRADFEDMVRAPIESTIGALSRTLDSAQVQPKQLSAVLLIGGSSRIPLVARMVSAELGRPTVVDTHPKYAVALGAATLSDEATTAGGHPPGTPAVTSNGLAGVIPAQRTKQQPTIRPTANSPHHPETAPATAPALAAQPDTRQSPTPRRIPPLPHSQAAPPAQPRTQVSPETTTPTNINTPPSSATPKPRVFTGIGRLGWLVAAGAVLTAIVAIVLAIGVGHHGSSPSGASSAQPAPDTRSTAGPEVAIPALGTPIQAGKTPTFVAVSPNGRHAYVANRDTQLVTVIDTAINQVTATIPTPAGPPQFLAFTPDGRKLYVTIYNDERTIHTIDVIDTASNTVIATIPQPARPFLPAVTPDEKRLFVPNHDVAAVSVIDTNTNKTIAQIKVPPNPHWVAFSPDGSRAYTANHESNVVSVIDVPTLTVVKTIPVGTSPHSIAIHPNLPLAANVNYDAGTVSVINTTTDQVTATIRVGDNPQDIIWAPDGRFAYVVNEGSNSVSVIDARTNQVTATIPTGTGPTSVAVLPNGRQAYISNLDSGTLTVLELTG